MFEHSRAAKDVSLMSTRQQILYLMNETREETHKRQYCYDEESRDLAEYLEEEKLRVLFTQKQAVPSLKQKLRQRYHEESSKVYKPIRKSIYLERKPNKVTSSEVMVCSCRPCTQISDGPFAGRMPIGCWKKCLNRLLCTECIAHFCPCKEYCTNRRFQNDEHLNVYPVKTDSRGWGLCAGQLIKKGSFIIQYVGEIYKVDSEIGQKRLTKYKSVACTYLMSTSNSEVIDPTKKGNLARFINHSCNPNCETQKWNVQGEICIGIFAKRDIQEDEELTFDYRFDMHKTSLSKCLCGSKNCRKYLGVIPSDFETVDDWEEKLESLTCNICRETTGEDDDQLMLCDGCNMGFHTYCLSPPLEQVPEDDWYCDGCNTSRITEKPRKRLKRARKTRTKESLMNEENGMGDSLQEFKMILSRGELEALRRNLEEISDLDVKLYWIKLNDEEDHELTVRGDNAENARKIIQNLRQEIPTYEQEPELISETELVFQSMLLNRLLGVERENYTRFMNEFNIRISYDSNSSNEVAYTLDSTTSIYLTGHAADVEQVAAHFSEMLDTLSIYTAYFSTNEVSLLALHINEIRNQLKPADFRVSMEPIYTDSNHPFYFYKKCEHRIFIIGTESEIEEGEKLIYEFLSNKQSGQLESSLNLMLPVSSFNTVLRMKIPLKEEAKQINPSIRTQFQIHQPVAPRKYLNIFLTGSWTQINSLVRRIFARIHEEEDMQKFYGHSIAQIYRHALKVSCKFMQALEKFGPGDRQEKLGSYGYNMKMWDIYAWDLIAEIGRLEDEGNLGKQVIHYLVNDSDAIVNALRLCCCDQEVLALMKRFEISNNTVMNHCIAHVAMFEERYGKMRNSVEFDDNYLTALNEIIGRAEEFVEEEELGNAKVLKLALEYARRESNKTKFNIFPVTYGMEVENIAESLEIEKKFKDFTDRMESKRFTLAQDDFKYNHEPLPVLPAVKKHADLVVATKRPDQYLYVVYAENAKKLRLLDK